MKVNCCKFSPGSSDKNQQQSTIRHHSSIFKHNQGDSRKGKCANAGEKSIIIDAVQWLLFYIMLQWQLILIASRGFLEGIVKDLGDLKISHLGAFLQILSSILIHA